MNHLEEESEDGELARSPVHADVMEFSLSEDDKEPADALDIKPPQAMVRKTSSIKHKDRHRQKSRREHSKHVHRNRESHMEKSRDTSKDFPRESHRDKNINYINKDRDGYRDYRQSEKDQQFNREMLRDGSGIREKHKEREIQRNRALQKDRELREKELRERIRDPHGKEIKDRHTYKEKNQKHSENTNVESRTQARLQAIAEGESLYQYEKENKSKHDVDKELEDLRSRLLSKRIKKESKEESNNRSNDDDESKQEAVDQLHHERKKRLLEAEKEMEKRKQKSRLELEERRERRRERKRPNPEPQPNVKKAKQSDPVVEDAVVISDTSDVEMKSESEEEEGEQSNTESGSESSSSSESSASDTEEGGGSDSNEEVEEEKPKPAKQSNGDVKGVRERSTTRSPVVERRRTPLSGNSKDRSRSRSRSHSFSPPPPGSKENIEADNFVENGDAKEKSAIIDTLPPYFPALQGCRSVEEFQCLNRIEEGTYGVVYRARDKTTNEVVALKRLKMEREREGFPITSLREINTLLKGQHPNIVTVREIVVGSNMDKIFIVMDYVEHDLKSLMQTMKNKKQVFLPGEVKCLMVQLLRAVHHLHNNWILHRDLKTSNLLLSHKGILKVGDFGLAREYGSPLRPYTPTVVTLWYRAPELLLCCKEYSTAIDMWSVGCIFAEFVTMNPLFAGKTEIDQLNRIFKELGTPSESIWPGYKQLPAVQKMTFAEFVSGGLRQRINIELLSEHGLSLLDSFLTYDPVKRISADSALEHQYFKEVPVAIDPDMFPTWPAKSEGGRKVHLSPKAPAGGSQMPRDDDIGFHMIPARNVQKPREISVTQGFSLKF